MKATIALIAKHAYHPLSENIEFVEFLLLIEFFWMVPLQKLGKVALLQPLSALSNTASELIFGANFNAIIYSLSLEF